MPAGITQSKASQLGLFGQPPVTLAETHRLFFALMPDEATRHAIGRAAVLIQEQYPELRARWVKSERYHATLNFLGDYPQLPEDVVEKARAAAKQLCAVSFLWSLDYATSFRGREPPCVLRGTFVPDAMLVLWRDLNSALAHVGLHRHIERQFTPHVTLAYGRRELPQAAPVVPIAWQIESVALIHNVVGKGHYEQLGRWPLLNPTR
ncbi:RNA 2',3'-cyclic phosphodiesterase [Dyella psychrodurans]|uniref:RNA 2',3'-cyclic phosphodiesterase n=1 Tax=Dyella psychrodurans TaxID=1927960 RepID=A0A370WW29_9GAMM|nr:RNA 2',3'-cyclic phosphodiesterase [Dyella psychrodurans]RDS80334.1 RNA 2',3'-cyclic phosphodiesterase [Dyella psychrodurans]